MTIQTASHFQKGISGSSLKIIAISAMFLDHVGAIFLSAFPAPYYALRLIGRIAFPIFAFLLVEGFLHTKHLKKYCLRLTLFAFLSEIPFDLAFYHTMFYWDSQNVFFTLLIGLITIWGVAYAETALHAMPQIRLLSQAAVMIFGMALACYLKTDYAEIGVLSIVLIYLFHKLRTMASICACAALCLLSSLEASSFAAVLLIKSYNGTRGLSLKYVFYLFYPLHLLLLHLFSTLIS